MQENKEMQEVKEVTIISLFAGRKYCLETYFNCLKLLNYPKNQISLIWVTNTQDESFVKTLSEKKEKLIEYNSIKLIHITDRPPQDYAFKENSTLTEVETGQKHATIITDLYNLAWGHNLDEYVMFLEDDAICHPDTLIRFLEITDKDDKIGYVTSSYKCRHTNQISPSFAQRLYTDKDNWVFAQFESNIEYDDVRDIDLSGWVCCMVRKSIVDRLPKPTFKMNGIVKEASILLGPDVVFTGELRGFGYRNVCDFGLRTGHLDSKCYIH